MSTNMADRPSRQVKKCVALERMMMKEQQRNKIKEVRKILKKSQFDLTSEESNLLIEHANIVKEIQQNIEKHRFLNERKKEIVDPPEVVEAKCQELADALRSASSVVMYTGAGISTAANIPDYRGPEGVWTLLRKGKKIEVPDLSIAEPTFTHMAIKEMKALGYIHHVVSQNCDGLHLRSDFPVKSLSEIHGNMLIEVCTTCKPVKQYIRLFDVTENTGLHRHATGRFCHKCGSELKDTIVHFGEKGKVSWPLNWKGAAKACSDADIILCLGSSLKVLRRYPCLWANHRPLNKRPKLYIVNLQWTPKDTQCTLKIHAKCDDVMKYLTSMLDIKVPSYIKVQDPIFCTAIPLTDDERDTTTRKCISSNLPHVESTIAPLSEEEEEKMDTKDNIQLVTNLTSPSNEAETLLQDAKPLKEETIDSCMDSETATNLDNQSSGVYSCGWYGKGCAKIRRPTKKRRV